MNFRVYLGQNGLGDWTARVVYLDDATEDRRIGFINRAEAKAWAMARVERHERFGVPGRLGGA